MFGKENQNPTFTPPQWQCHCHRSRTNRPTPVPPRLTKAKTVLISTRLFCKLIHILLSPSCTQTSQRGKLYLLDILQIFLKRVVSVLAFSRLPLNPEGLLHCTVPRKILKVSTESSVSGLHPLAGTVFTQFFRPDVPNLPRQRSAWRYGG